MKRYEFFFLLLVILFSVSVRCQSYDQQRRGVLLNNIISNALIGGVGGAINKKPEEKIFKVFIKGLLKGSAGGLIKYSAKYQVFYFGNSNQVLYAPINRLYFFLGHSIVLNAAYNKRFLETYTCNFYGIEMRYSQRAEKRFTARLSLATVASAVAFGLRGYELNLFETLEQGQFFFDVRNNLLPGTAQSAFNCLAVEVALNNVNYGALPHEIVHTYQMYDYFGFSSLYKKKVKRFYEEKNWYRSLSKYLVTDHEVLFFTGLFLLQPKPTYYKNYYEFEAQHFRSRGYIRRY